MKALKLTVATILVGTLTVWGLYQYHTKGELQAQIRLAADARRHEQESARRREQAERSFSLSDAYKQPPASYVQSRDQLLYGRISPTKGDDSTWGAVTAQDLDKMLLAADTFKVKCSQAQADKDNAAARFGEKLVQQISAEQGKPLDRSGLDIIREAVRKATIEIFEPNRQAAVKAALEAQEATLADLVTEQRLLPLASDVKVQVLDISGHYVKLTVIDGDHAGRTVFILPGKLLTK